MYIIGYNIQDNTSDITELQAERIKKAVTDCQVFISQQY